MKKGILFTVTILLVTAILLSLATLNFKNLEKTKDRLSESGSLTRLYTTSDSVALGFKKIFNVSSGINITINDQNITLEEFLPNNNAVTFKNNLDTYKNYIESQNENIKLDIVELKDKLPLVILLHNITYKHNSFGGNEIIVNPNQINFNKYLVEIEPGFNVTSCTWNSFNGGLIFELKTNNATCNREISLDYNQNNVININNGGMLITINNSLSILNNLAAVKIKTFINLNKIENEKITVWSDKKVINLAYERLNISKISGFRII